MADLDISFGGGAQSAEVEAPKAIHKTLYFHDGQQGAS